mgnify:CR=1 FL=1
MPWAFNETQPIYQQIIAAVKANIASGRYSPGEKLPSVRDLALEAGVNPNTMQRALSELEREGLVYSQRTAGRFITEDRQLLQNLSRELAAGQVQTMIQAVRALGYDGEQILRLVQDALEEAGAAERQSERKG